MTESHSRSMSHWTGAEQERPLWPSLEMVSAEKLSLPKEYLLPYPYRIHGAAIYGNMDPINIPPLC